MKATHHPLAVPDTTTNTAVTPAVLLRCAALYLQTHGWTQGEVFDYLAQDSFPPACAIGAINAAAYGRCILTATDDTTLFDHDAWGVMSALRMFAACLDPDYDPFQTSAIDVIGQWNDAEHRTRDEVIQALNEAADDWDAAHSAGGAR
ncbi:DUF6197 family protein [Couchioplanes azureus]|nr:hypothetical protein [Couchioplanes caeruleus]GGQ86744.1 hypothetical protein GCM10010166_66110 [Couchioplanes caeruleus subsp. azureus]